MDIKILNIKNMVCDRCIMSVKTIFEEMKIDYKSITLGTVTMENNILDEQIEELDNRLHKIGFEIIQDDKLKIVEKIKNEIINLIYKDPETIENTNLSYYLSQKLNSDYSSLSNMFSKQTGTTIEKYFILQKIERIKELISYKEMNISEIAYTLGYKSSQHLSAQFKKITGISPSAYKRKSENRKPLDKV